MGGSIIGVRVFGVLVHVCLFVCLSICLSVCLSVNLCVCVSARLCFWVSVRPLTHPLGITKVIRNNEQMLTRLLSRIIIARKCNANVDTNGVIGCALLYSEFAGSSEFNRGLGVFVCNTVYRQKASAALLLRLVCPMYYST